MWPPLRIRANRGEQPIPVEVFEGTPEQALARAAGANTKDKLAMTTTGKTNAAWRLEVMGETLSKAQQAEAAGVSERLVAMMRNPKATMTGKRRTPAHASFWMALEVYSPHRTKALVEPCMPPV